MHDQYITRIAPDDPRVVAAEAAERRLFEHYGLSYTVHHVALDEPAMRVRVLDIGMGTPVLVVPGGSGDAWQFAPLIAHLTGRPDHVPARNQRLQAFARQRRQRGGKRAVEAPADGIRGDGSGDDRLPPGHCVIDVAIWSAISSPASVARSYRTFLESLGRKGQ